MTRRCPKCSELVPTNSLTCPKCYTKMPPETVKVKDEDTARSDAALNRRIAVLLTIIPGFFGFLGLGRIYQEPKSHIGYLYLILGFGIFIIAGALLFVPPLGIITAALKTILGVGLILVYLMLFVLSILDSLLNIHLLFR